MGKKKSVVFIFFFSGRILYSCFSLVHISFASCPDLWRFCITWGTYVSVVHVFEAAGRVCAPQLKGRNGVQHARPPWFRCFSAQERLDRVYSCIWVHWAACRCLTGCSEVTRQAEFLTLDFLILPVYTRILSESCYLFLVSLLGGNCHLLYGVLRTADERAKNWQPETSCLAV